MVQLVQIKYNYFVASPTTESCGREGGGVNIFPNLPNFFKFLVDPLNLFSKWWGERSGTNSKFIGYN